MHYRPVVDRFVEIPSLDPIWFMLFVAAFIAVALLTQRRPLFGLLALIASAPFAFAHGIGHTTITLPKITLLAVALGLCAHPALVLRLRTREARWWLVAFAAVAAATLLSVTQAAFFAPALRESLKALEALAIFAVAILASEESDALERFALPTFAATAVLVSLLALIEVVIGAPSGLNLGAIVLPRIAGPLDGPNQLAGFLEIAIAILLAAQLARPRRYLAWSLTAVFLAEILTLSRAGIFLSAGIVVLLSFLRPQNVRAALIPALASVPIAAGVIAAAILAARTFGGANLADSATLIGGLLRVGARQTGAGGVGTRPELWRAAIALWRQHPWLGIGAGNYHLELARVGLPSVRTQPNSLYLRALVDGGLPLLSATLWLWIGGFVRLARASIRSDAWAAAFAATIALALHGVVDNLQFYPKVLAWWLLLVALAVARQIALARSAE